MKFIDKLHSMADEVVETVQWPFRKRMIERSFESVIDAVESARLTVETQIAEKQRALTKISNEDEAKKIIDEILDLRYELEEAEKRAAIAKSEKLALFDTDVAK